MSLCPRLGQDPGESTCGRAQAVVQALADSVHDGKLRQHFLALKSVRDL